MSTPVQKEIIETKEEKQARTIHAIRQEMSVYRGMTLNYVWIQNAMLQRDETVRKSRVRDSTNSIKNSKMNRLIFMPQRLCKLSKRLNLYMQRSSINSMSD